ncbi:MAG: hypothetical protein AABY22_32290 [Nanoarchaeota archaeon]
MKKIQIILPKGYMNVGVTLDNHLVADTNNSANWDTLKFPLPKGKWSIYNQEGKVVMLERRSKLYFF